MYSKDDGACIGNSLSGFMAVYRRYIDDTFAIHNKRKLEPFKKLLEHEMDKVKKGAMKFTIERQTAESRLPFLNVMCEVTKGKVTVDVYRKPTKTMRIITSDSFHDIKHKMAAYHSMAHFMASLPLDEDKIEAERAKIVRIGIVNEYRESTIQDLVQDIIDTKRLIGNNKGQAT